MHKIKITFNGKQYQFRYYWTTINVENIYFVRTDDKEAIRIMVEDHFFITFDIRGQSPFQFNCISGEKEEMDFKMAIATEILTNS
jgi:hypothetical protein